MFRLALGAAALCAAVAAGETCSSDSDCLENSDNTVCLRTGRCGPASSRRACGNRASNQCSAGDSKRCTRGSNCAGDTTSCTKDMELGYKTCTCPGNQVFGALPEEISRCGMDSVFPAAGTQGCFCPEGTTLDEESGFCLDKCCEGPMIALAEKPCHNYCEDGQYVANGCSSEIVPGCGCPQGRLWFDSASRQCFATYLKCPQANGP